MGRRIWKLTKECQGLNNPENSPMNGWRSTCANMDTPPCAHTPALCTHVTLPITFTLVVDDFGVKYTGKHTALHLLSTLKDLYTVSVDYTGNLYCGLAINWD